MAIFHALLLSEHARVFCHQEECSRTERAFPIKFGDGETRSVTLLFSSVGINHLNLWLTISRRTPPPPYTHTRTHTHAHIRTHTNTSPSTGTQPPPNPTTTVISNVKRAAAKDETVNNLPSVKLNITKKTGAEPSCVCVCVCVCVWEICQKIPNWNHFYTETHCSWKAHTWTEGHPYTHAHTTIFFPMSTYKFKPCVGVCVLSRCHVKSCHFRDTT